MKFIKCHNCGRNVDIHKTNTVYSKHGIHHYCKNEDCQKRFIEEAGDPPEYDELYLD